MKQISDTAFEKIPVRPNPDQISDWKNSEVTKWLLANLVFDFFAQHEELAATNFGDAETDLRAMYVIQGKIEALSAIIEQLEPKNDE